MSPHARRAALYAAAAVLSLALVSCGDNPCGTAERNLAERAATSPYLSLPAHLKASTVYSDCDVDDAFVVAGRSFDDPRPFAAVASELSSYLTKQGLHSTPPDDSDLCQVISVNGQPFRLRLTASQGPEAPDYFFELSHALGRTHETC